MSNFCYLSNIFSKECYKCILHCHFYLLFMLLVNYVVIYCETCYTSEHNTSHQDCLRAILRFPCKIFMFQSYQKNNNCSIRVFQKSQFWKKFFSFLDTLWNLLQIQSTRITAFPFPFKQGHSISFKIFNITTLN